MAKKSHRPPDRYARVFWIPAALALLTPPILLSIALLLSYLGARYLAPSVMNLAFYSSFICIFLSIIVVLSAVASWMFGVVRFTHIRLAVALALLGFFTNYLVFTFVVFKFYRPH